MFVQEDPLYVDLHVIIMANTSCNSTIMSWPSEWRWYPYNALNNIINVFLLSKLDLTSFIVTDRPLQFNLMLHLDELPCSNQTKSDIAAALPPFLSWVSTEYYCTIVILHELFFHTLEKSEGLF